MCAVSIAAGAKIVYGAGGDVSAMAPRDCRKEKPTKHLKRLHKDKENMYQKEKEYHS